jgi:predicted N-formylglutamate amidohydrolase
VSWRLGLLTCEHASSAVPDGVALGVDPSVLDSHVAWDPGALAIAEALRERFGTPLHAGTWSRLVVDLNRDPDGAYVVPEVAFGVPVPGNAALSAELRTERVAALHRPFREAVLAAAVAEAHRAPLLHLSVHSFTPRLEVQGRFEVRDYPLGVLFDEDRAPEVAVAERILGALRAAGWDARANQPYAGSGEGTTTWLRRELPPDRYSGLEVEWNHGGSDERRAAAVEALCAVLRPFSVRLG